MIPRVSSKIELEYNRNQISGTKIHPIFEGSVVMNICAFECIRRLKVAMSNLTCIFFTFN